MKPAYYPPKYGVTKFHCIHCGVFSAQSWVKLHMNIRGAFTPTSFVGSQCFHCEHWAYWYEEKMIVPAEAPVEPAHCDLPEDCQPEYNEAREIFARSPRASAALLRLCIQKLMPHLGQKGKSINNDIGALVANGLPPLVQQALDFCRVVGNNAVHPGEIDLNDTPEVAQQLFKMINFIVEDRITRPKEIEALYGTLPIAARDAIEKRDQGSGNGAQQE